MKTVRRPPYPKWNPGYFPCSSLTPPLPLSSRRPSVSFGGFGLRQKLRRANIHLNALRRVTKRFRESDAYSVGHKIISQADTFYQVSYMEKWEPLPASIPEIVGDICNNPQIGP